MGQRPVLFVGDLHLGRRVPRAGRLLQELGLESRLASAVAAWERTVDWARERRVRAVVLAGDVVDTDRDRFEAYGHLERGALRLAEAGIPVVAVAGNHDWMALPRLAGRVTGVHLLGRGGRWELWPVPGDGPPVDIVGWSFPGREARDDPTRDPSFQAAVGGRRPGALLVGLVHGDLDEPASHHAPLDRRRLEELPPDAWLLGHIHRPDPLQGPRPMGYLGSAAALDPGEPGPHGPWELTLEAGEPALRHVPLAPVRYERIEVTVADAADADAVWDAVHAAARQALEGPLAAAPARPEAVLLRVRLRGTLANRTAGGGLSAGRGQFFEVAGIPCAVEHLEDLTRPPVDLERLAAEPSPAGEVARLILELQTGEIPGELADAAKDALAAWRRDPWNPPEAPAPPPSREALLAAAWRALELLLAHRVEGSP